MDVAKVKNLNAKTRGRCEMRTVGIITSIMCIFVLSSGVSLADDWHIETVDTTGNVGVYTSIALDSGDNPHISYLDWTNDDLKYAWWMGTTWAITSIDTAGDVGFYTSIALDSSDNPHISYFDGSNADLKYAYCIRPVWYIISVDTTGLVGWYTSIALDSGDNPHISYHYNTYDDLKYAYWNGSHWSITTVDTRGEVGRYSSIALDSNDNPHISYYDEYYLVPIVDLNYAYWTGSTWIITSVHTSGAAGSHTSIALDSNDNPHISYYDIDQCGLNYAYWTGYYWSITTVDITGYVGQYTSIALDSYDYPHISYYDWSNEDLKYSYWNGSNWSITTVDTTGEVGKYTSLVLDSNDNPHISYYDGTNGDLKYARYGPDVGINLKHFTAHAEGETITLKWSVETTEGEEIVGFNLYRRTLATEGDPALGGGSPTESKDQFWEQVNDHLITGENPYTYTDSDVESSLAYEYKLEAVLADDSAETLGTTQATAGIPPASFAIIALYPNPASDTLTCLLALHSAGAVELTLYDLSGRLVLEKRLEVSEPSELSTQLDVSGLASGVYTLRASFGGAEVSPACGGVAVVVR